MDDVGFVGDRLRLTSFVRAVERMPRRPSRCRRRRGIDNSQNGQLLATSLQSPQQLQLEDVSSVSQGLTASSDLAVSNALMTDLPLEDSNSGTEQQLRNLPAFSREETGDQLRFSSINNQTQSGPSRTASLFQESLTRNQQRSAAGHFLPKDPKTLIVYRSKAKKAGPRTRDLHTRKMRLSVNELALVRTTTADDFFDRGDDVALKASITDCDPIEDSQIVTAPPTQPTTVKFTGRRIQKAQRDDIPPPTMTRFPWKPRTNTSHASKTPADVYKRFSRATLKAVSDGFTSLELCIRPNLKRQAIKHSKQKRRLSVQNRDLALAKGELPTPAMEDDCRLFAPGSLIMNQDPHEWRLVYSAPQGEDTIHGALGRESACANERSPLFRDQATSRACRRMATRNEVFSRLASITAPARPSTDSESDGGESFEEDGNDHQGGFDFSASDSGLEYDSGGGAAEDDRDIDDGSPLPKSQQSI